MRMPQPSTAALLIVACLLAAPAARAAQPQHSAPRQAAPAPTLRVAQATEKAGAPTAPRKPAQPAAKPAAALIDINSASEEALAELPGIGEARAKAIVKGRPYARKDELVRRKIIPQRVYGKIRERIIAKRS